MSLIVCTDPCVYQIDGYCSLSRAASPGDGRSGCVNFVARSEQESNFTLQNYYTQTYVIEYPML